MEPLRLTDNIAWVGKVDDRRVPFHRLILEKGTTYNSYLLMTEKPTIIDTVDIAFGKEYMENLSKIIDPSDIQYIVINHIEPDHAGALPALAAKAIDATIVCTETAVDALKEMFKLHNRSFLIVKDGDTLDIGGKTLKFIETPYLHTEETMITYAVEDEILFPCDIFSTHIANQELFNDLAKQEYEEDFKVYYSLIMAPHRPYVRDMLDKIKDLPIRIIAPSHGYILRENVANFIDLYDKMSASKEPADRKSVVIAYSTMTGNTGKIAEKLARGLENANVQVTIYNLKKADLNEVKHKILNSNGVLVGSSTRYGDMVGNVEELLTSLIGEEVSHLPAAAFGSYGWSGEAISHVEDYLDRIGFQVVDQNYLIKTLGLDTPLLPHRIRFTMNGNLETSVEAGKVFGEQILSK